LPIYNTNTTAQIVPVRSKGWGDAFGTAVKAFSDPLSGRQGVGSAFSACMENAKKQRLSKPVSDLVSSRDARRESTDAGPAEGRAAVVCSCVKMTIAC
jgi:hypothetical protein